MSGRAIRLWAAPASPGRGACRRLGGGNCTGTVGIPSGSAQAKPCDSLLSFGRARGCTLPIRLRIESLDRPLSHQEIVNSPPRPATVSIRRSRGEPARPRAGPTPWPAAGEAKGVALAVWRMVGSWGAESEVADLHDQDDAQQGAEAGTASIPRGHEGKISFAGDRPKLYAEGYDAEGARSGGASEMYPTKYQQSGRTFKKRKGSRTAASIHAQQQRGCGRCRFQ